MSDIRSSDGFWSQHAGPARQRGLPNSFPGDDEDEDVNRAEGALACDPSPRSSPVDIRPPRPRAHLRFSPSEWNHHPPRRRRSIIIDHESIDRLPAR